MCLPEGSQPAWESSLSSLHLSFPTSFSVQHLNRLKSFAQECLKCLWVRLCENPFCASGRFSGKLSPVFLEAMMRSVPTTQKLNLHRLLGTQLIKIEELQTGIFLCFGKRAWQGVTVLPPHLNKYSNQTGRGTC